LLKLFSD